MVNSIVADGFARIKNAQSVNNLETTVLYSKFMLEILTVLRNEGYIRGFSLNTGKIKVYLKYFNKNPTFNNISLISKPSRKIFYSVSNLLKKNTQTGTFIISTSQGLFSSRDAVKKNLGGEVVCYIT
jgi:small subunit ribosomal protein S8|tara:strand:+ start:448 stop:828 length:381 start_codon:yes stop_codon:yes gene_type:complete